MLVQLVRGAIFFALCRQRRRSLAKREGVLVELDVSRAQNNAFGRIKESVSLALVIEAKVNTQVGSGIKLGSTDQDVGVGSAAENSEPLKVRDATVGLPELARDSVQTGCGTVVANVRCMQKRKTPKVGGNSRFKHQSSSHVPKSPVGALGDTVLSRRVRDSELLGNTVLSTVSRHGVVLVFRAVVGAENLERAIMERGHLAMKFDEKSRLFGFTLEQARADVASRIVHVHDGVAKSTTSANREGASNITVNEFKRRLTPVPVRGKGISGRLRPRTDCTGSVIAGTARDKALDESSFKSFDRSKAQMSEAAMATSL